MSVDFISLLLNIMIAGLLIANISYCWVLNNRIKILQDGKSELANLLQYFDESTARASESIIALQTASKKIGENMQNKIDKANYLMDDLAFMVEKGNILTDQLDANLAVNRARKRVFSEERIDDDEVLTREKDIGENVTKSSFAVENKAVPRIVERNSNKEKTTASLEAVIGRMVGRPKPVNIAGNAGQSVDNAASEKEAHNLPQTPSKSRSKAEQELLNMIRAGIKG